MPTTSLASTQADSDALGSSAHEHAELLGGLATRTDALVASARTGGAWQGDRDALAAWYRAELLPHLATEEQVLYPAARGSQYLAPLVRALLHERALLDELVTRLRSAADAPTAVLHAGAVQALCETHVAKEDDLLLPALAAAPGTSLAQLSAEMQALHEQHETPGDLPPATSSTATPPHGHACTCHDDGGEPELDARTIPHAIRHATIFGALDAVAPTATLILVAPHEPLPLLGQIGQRSPGAFDIEYLQRGPDAWRLRFTRRPATPGTR